MKQFNVTKINSDKITLGYGFPGNCKCYTELIQLTVRTLLNMTEIHIIAVPLTLRAAYLPVLLLKSNYQTLM